MNVKSRVTPGSRRAGGSAWRPGPLTVRLAPQRVTDDGVVQLCRGCPRLQALCLSGCGSLTDASLTALALNCPRLQ